MGSPIEITFDLDAYRIEGSTPFTTARWKQVEGPWVDMVRRALKLPEFVVMFHKRSRKWVLGGWSIPGRAFIECESLTYNPTITPGFSHKTNIDWLKWRFRPTRQQAEEALHGRDQRNRQHLQDRRDDLTQRTSLVKQLRKRGLQDAADSIEYDGTWVGEKAGGEALQQTREELKSLTSTKEYYT